MRNTTLELKKSNKGNILNWIKDSPRFQHLHAYMITFMMIKITPKICNGSYRYAIAAYLACLHALCPSYQGLIEVTIL